MDIYLLEQEDDFVFHKVNFFCDNLYICHINRKRIRLL